jgi:phage FluMu protein Com
MVDEKGSLKIKCPSCGKILSVTGVRMETALDCPYCKTRIKITQPSEPLLSEGEVPELDEDEIYRYEHDIKIFDQLPLIKHIVVKDVLALKKFLLILFVIGLIIAGLTSAQAASMARSQAADESGSMQNQTLTDEEEEKEEFDNIQTFYSMTIFISIWLLIAIVNFVYGSEVKRGTMRLLCLYPLNMNGLTLAKIFSTALILGIIMFFVLFIPSYPFMATNVYPWLSSVLLMGFIINFFIIITGAFATHIVTFITGKLYISMNRLIIIMIVIYVFLTEFTIRAIGQIYISLTQVSGPQMNKVYQQFIDLGKGLSQFSPYHSGGRLLMGSLGHNSGGPDLHFILLIGIALIIVGYVLGKKIYLDVFIRE